MRQCLALTWLLAAAPLAAQGLLTLPAALRQAGQTSLQADLADLARTGARQEEREVRAAYLPTLQFKGGHLNQDHDTALRTEPFQLGPIGVPSMENPIAQRSSWRYQLSADYLVFDFGKRASALAATLAKGEAVDLRGRETVRRAQAEVAARYLAVLNVKARLLVVAQRRQALQDHLRDAQALFQQGVVARNDVLRAEVALRGVADAARTLDNQLLSSGESLNVALGQPPATPLALPEALGEPPALPWDEAGIRARSAAGNDGVKALQAKVKAAEDLARLRRRDYTPNVVAQLEHTYQENRFLVHPNETSLFLGLSWKVFDGGVRSAKLSQARADQDTAARELLEARRQAENAAVQARRGFQEALAEMESAKANVAAALENLRIVKDQYREGYAKGVDVLDAENVVAESRFSLADRHYRAYAQQAVLLAVLGEDLAAFYTSTLER
jgi:outer membrane protein TolC